MDSVNSNVIEETRARRALPSPAMRKAIRQDAGVSLRRAGAALGVSGQAVALWERGERTPRGANLTEYVELLRQLQELAR